MKLLRLFSFGIACAALTGFHPDAALAATFTYHGSLQDSGKPAEGGYDLELTLYTSAGGGRVMGGPLVLYKVPVHAGSFSTQADFGALADSASTAWLEVKVRSSGSGKFAVLSARAPVSATETASVCPGAWTLDGNAGTSPGTGLGQNYLGTADSQPLILAVNGAQAASLIPSGNSTYPDSANIVFGSWGNFGGNLAVGATVSGGGSLSAFCGPSNNQPCVNSATSFFASVGGGLFNQATAPGATVGGGDYNQATDSGATVAGGDGDVASGKYSGVLGGTANFASGEYSGVLGGFNNFATGVDSAVGGGDANEATGDYAVVSGGAGNQASGQSAVVSGGEGNQASGVNAVVAGGAANQATGASAVVSGGTGNQATGFESSVPGGNSNTAAGDRSFAAGWGAVVRAPTGTCVPGACGDYGTFVWSDGSTYGFSSSGPDQFLVQAVGGVAINTTPVNNTVELTVAASPNGSDYANLFLRQSIINAGILLSSGGATASANNDAVFSIDQYNGTTQKHVMKIDAAGNTYNITGAWTMFSDRRLKHDIAPIEHPLDTLLALRGEIFEYIDPSQAMAQPGRRMGFIAQDVEKVLPQWVGEDERGYKNVTPTGFEALSVEALRELRAEKDAEIQVLQSKLDELSARLARVEAARGQ